MSLLLSVCNKPRLPTSQAVINSGCASPRLPTSRAIISSGQADAKLPGDQRQVVFSFLVNYYFQKQGCLVDVTIFCICVSASEVDLYDILRFINTISSSCNSTFERIVLGTSFLSGQQTLEVCLRCLLSSSEDDVKVDQELVKPTGERHEENRRTRDKMNLVRSQMDKCSWLKANKDKVNMWWRIFPRL